MSDTVAHGQDPETVAPDPVVLEPTSPVPDPAPTEGRRMPPEIKRLRDSHGKHYVLINGTLRSVEAREKMSKKERLRRRKAK